MLILFYIVLCCIFCLSGISFLKLGIFHLLILLIPLIMEMTTSHFFYFVLKQDMPFLNCYCSKYVCIWVSHWQKRSIFWVFKLVEAFCAFWKEIQSNDIYLQYTIFNLSILPWCCYVQFILFNSCFFFRVFRQWTLLWTASKLLWRFSFFSSMLVLCLHFFSQMLSFFFCCDYFSSFW